ncbi:MAG: anthranilate phosphoribosyltransferase [Nitrososphaerales archaeon]
MIREAIAKLTEFKDLSSEEAYHSLKEIVSHQANESQISAFLTALKMKGESAEEIVGLAKAMLESCIRIKPQVNLLVDTCGTGGDSLKTINVSTISAFIVSASGISVAKHGNRAFTSKCGSADVLEALGYNLNLEPDKVKEMIEKIGFGFLFAPKFHIAMKEVSKVRRDLGFRTIFNIVGPLTNPSNPPFQLIGVFEPSLICKLAKSLKSLGKRGLVVHGNGMDEISVTSETSLALIEEDIKFFTLKPKDFGIENCKEEELLVKDAKDSILSLFNILYGLDRSAKLKLCLANSAALIYWCSKADSLIEAIEIAEESVKSGKAYKILKDCVKFSDGNLSILEELERKYG